MVTAVFDLTTGKEIAQGLAGDTASIALPGGDVISTNSSEMRRSTTRLVPLRTLAKPTAGANEFEISDDGRILLLAGVAQQASLYDVASGRKLGFDLPTSSPDFTSAHLSPDGKTLVTNTRRGVLEWDLDPADMAAAACRMAGRELTAAEWATYFPGERQTPVCAALTAAGAR
jgi:WD40 repeat protein